MCTGRDTSSRNTSQVAHKMLHPGYRKKESINMIQFYTNSSFKDNKTRYKLSKPNLFVFSFFQEFHNAKIN